jgi:hypothetical protein
MRSVSRGVRVFSFSLGLMLAACGGSSSTKKDGGGDASVNDDGNVGDPAVQSDGGLGGTAGVDGGGTAGVGGGATAGVDGGGAAGVDGGGAAGAEGGVTTSDGGDAIASDGGDASAQDGASDGSSDASSDVSVEAPAPAGLCTPYVIHAPVVSATIVNDGASPYVAGFLGGALASGTYYLTNVVHFGATYAGPTQEVLVVDATAHTLGAAAVTGTTTTYVGYATTISPANVLVGAASCGGATATSWNYLVTGTGAGSTVSLNVVGSSDVEVFTKQ